MQNFLERIAKHAKNNPDWTAIRLGKDSISYSELYSNILKISEGALASGLRKGDNLLFSCKPNIEGLSLALGLVYSGITITIVDPFTSDALFANRCKSAEVTHIVAPAFLYKVSSLYNKLPQIGNVQIANLNAMNLPKIHFNRQLLNSRSNAMSWFRKSGDRAVFNTQPDLPAVIVFTSGTTSEPKGVVHTLSSLSANIDETAKELGIKTQTRVYSEPMTIGLVALSHGAEWIIPNDKHSIPECDVWFGTPKEILDVIDYAENHQDILPSRLKLVGVGAAPVLPSLVNRIVKAIPHHVDVKCVYGMTEMLPIAIGDAKLKESMLLEGDYIGKPLSNVSVTIDDHGSVFIGGAALMKNYTKIDGSPIEEVLSLDTGDFGALLDNGHLILKGRKKEMFIRGSMNVYPGLYEPGLSTIEGVKEAIVCGLPNKYGDDEIVLAVTTLKGYNPQDVERNVYHNMAVHMDKDALPSRIFMMEKLPLSGRANKLDRKKLQNQLIERNNV